MFPSTSKLRTILQFIPQNTVVYNFELEGDIDMKLVKILYSQVHVCEIRMC